jgi:hypothetical protein
VFNANVDSLGDDALPDLLVDNDSDGPGVDVEDSSSSSVVVLVWHTLMDGTIDYNINNISDFVGSKGLGDMDCSVLLESFFEFVSGSALVSVAVSHGSQI